MEYIKTLYYFDFLSHLHRFGISGNAWSGTNELEQPKKKKKKKSNIKLFYIVQATLQRADGTHRHIPLVSLRVMIKISQPIYFSSSTPNMHSYTFS